MCVCVHCPLGVSQDIHVIYGTNALRTYVINNNHSDKFNEIQA